MALSASWVEIKNAAGLLRNDYRHGVRFFRDSEAGAMTQSEASVQCFALTHRENAGRGCDPPIAHDDSAIVKRGFWMKNCQNELDRKIAIDRHASLLLDANRRIALNRDHSAELFVRQLVHCLCKILDCFAFFARYVENRMPADPAQPTAHLP